jgi:hypothetical protein
MEMGAQEIADIYKRRWQVELFFQMDKTESEDKVVLESRWERGIQPDMGGTCYTGAVMDMQNAWRDNGFRPSDIVDDKNNSPFLQRFYSRIMYEQTVLA